MAPPNDTDNVVYEAHKKTTTTRVTMSSMRRLGSNLASKGREVREARREAREAREAQQPALDLNVPEIPPPALDGPPSICNTPAPIDPKGWSSMPGSTFAVRGSSYVTDSVKVASAPSLFRLLAVDIVRATSQLPQNSVCLHPEERVQRALAREASGEEGEAVPFVFVVNLCMPSGNSTSSGNGGNGSAIAGSRSGSDNLSRSASIDSANTASSESNIGGGGYPHLVAYYAIDDLSLIDGSNTTPEAALLHKFIFGEDDQFRHSTFKLLPRIAEGNAVVKRAVGSKPAIMGRKLKQTYVRSGRRFMEVIIDVGSSSVATKIVKLSLSYAKTLVVDMAFVLEGKDGDVLPERIIGSVRLKNVDFKNTQRLVVV